jgi:hypothetical protein
MTKIDERTYDEVIGLLKEKGLETDDSIINGSFVKTPEGEDNLLFDGFKYGVKEFLDEANTKRLTISDRHKCFDKALLQTFADRHLYDEYRKNNVNNKPRYFIAERLLINYNTEQGNIDGRTLDIFEHITSSFVSFISSLHFQQARRHDVVDEQQQSITDRIKEAF